MNNSLKKVEKDRLVKEANDTIQRLYQEPKHTVAAALLCGSGKIYTAVNVYVAPLGTCAEPIVFGKAISEGETEFKSLACIRGRKGEILAPCGNCRQLLLDYAPNLDIILEIDGQAKTIKPKDLLPFAYQANND